MTEQTPTYITRHDVETALARIGKALPEQFNDEYFTGLALRGGKGDGSEGERCSIQERRAWETLQASSDAIPETDCPVVGRFIISFQDRIADKAVRTRLMSPLLLLLIGSKGDAEVERRRYWLSVDWAIREASVVWLERAPELADFAAELKALPEIRDRASADTARSILRRAASAGYAKRDELLAAYREKLTDLVKDELEKRGIKPGSAVADAAAVAAAAAAAAAVAAAVAAAAADAAAVAAADAAAAAVADAAAAADAVAVAAADAAAAAVADAAAAADAVAVAAAEPYSERWFEIRRAVRKALSEEQAWIDWRERFLASVADTRLAVWERGAKCIGRMLAVTADTLAAEARAEPSS